MAAAASTDTTPSRGHHHRRRPPARTDRGRHAGDHHRAPPPTPAADRSPRSRSRSTTAPPGTPPPGTPAGATRFVPSTLGPRTIRVPRHRRQLQHRAPSARAAPSRSAPAVRRARSGAATPLPTVAADRHRNAIEVGVKFRPAVDGFVSGIRFYKGAGNGGTARRPPLDGHRHAAGDRHVHRRDGQSAGRQVSLPAPVPVTAGQTYVASYHAPAAATPPTPATSRRRVRRSAPARAGNDEDGRQRRVPLRRAGVPVAVVRRLELLGRRGLRPQRQPRTRGDRPRRRRPPSGVSRTGAGHRHLQRAHAAGVRRRVSSRRSAGTPVPGTMTYDAPTRMVRLQPSAPLIARHDLHRDGHQRLRHVGPAHGRARDVELHRHSATPAPAREPVGHLGHPRHGGGERHLAGRARRPLHRRPSTARQGRALLQGAAATVGRTSGTSGPAPARSWRPPPSPTRRPSGWQQANFAGPIPIAAGTTYIVSYLAPDGRYSVTAGYFDAAVDRARCTLRPRRGGNGYYRYGAGGGFPTSTLREHRTTGSTSSSTRPGPHRPRRRRPRAGARPGRRRPRAPIRARFDEPVTTVDLSAAHRRRCRRARHHRPTTPPPGPPD